MKTPKIPQNLYPKIMDLASQGMVGKEIKSWLKSEHDIDASLSTVLRTLKIVKEERAAITKEVYQEAALKVAEDDLESINGAILSLSNDLQQYKETDSLRHLQIMAELRKWIELRMKLNGAFENQTNVQVNVVNNPDHLNNLRADLAQKLGITDFDEEN